MLLVYVSFWCSLLRVLTYFCYIVDYNIRDEFLCSDIQKLILSLRQIPVLYSRYVVSASRTTCTI